MNDMKLYKRPTREGKDKKSTSRDDLRSEKAPKLTTLNISWVLHWVVNCKKKQKYYEQIFFFADWIEFWNQYIIRKRFFYWWRLISCRKLSRYLKVLYSLWLINSLLTISKKKLRSSMLLRFVRGKLKCIRRIAKEIWQQSQRCRDKFVRIVITHNRESCTHRNHPIKD